jgi:hypothetical protein
MKAENKDGKLTMRYNYDKIAESLWQSWEKSANHEKLDFAQINNVRAAAEIIDKIVQIGQSLQVVIEETE